MNDDSPMTTPGDIAPDGPAATGGPMFDVVAIAASAGGLRALIALLSSLPSEFAAAIVVVQHLDPRHRSMMASILARRTALHVKQADDGDRLTPGWVLIAPPEVFCRSVIWVPPVRAVQKVTTTPPARIAALAVPTPTAKSSILPPNSPLLTVGAPPLSGGWKAARDQPATTLNRDWCPAVTRVLSAPVALW